MKIRRTLSRPLFLSLLLAATLGGPTLYPRAATRIPAAAAAFKPSFVATACPFKPGQGLAVGTDLRCGFVVVLEDHNAPTNGRTIKLAVAIFRGRGTVHHTDPLIFLQGGPGGSIVDSLGPLITRKTYASFVTNRDLVLIDQRGTGHSVPNLNCKELTAIQFNTLDQNLSLQRQADLQASGARQCHDRLMRSGVKLNVFTTLQNAADISDLRTALGYAALNIYGVSYGTRLALTIMRTQPQGIRSVVIDSVLPPSADLVAGPLRTTQRVFKVLFDGCVASTRCNAAYPNLQSTFYRVVAKLDAHPATIATKDNAGKSYTVLLNGDGFVGLLFSSLYVTPYISALPAMIFLADHGDYRIPSLIYGGLVLDQSVSIGMYYSVECGEDVPFTSPTAVYAAAQGLNSVIRPGEVSGQLVEFRICKNWNVSTVASTQKAPVRSNIPTLIFSGEYDPITPPADSLLTSKTLPNSTRFVFPGTGHGVYMTNPCPDSILRTFIDAPTTKPTGSCIASMTEPAFLTSFGQ